MIRRPPSSTLFPSTTLSRSDLDVGDGVRPRGAADGRLVDEDDFVDVLRPVEPLERADVPLPLAAHLLETGVDHVVHEDRKSTRLNSSHANISYAVFCLKKKT